MALGGRYTIKAGKKVRVESTKDPEPKKAPENNIQVKDQGSKPTVKKEVISDDATIEK